LESDDELHQLTALAEHVPAEGDTTPLAVRERAFRVIGAASLPALSA
jgi:hypothetical protein